MTDYTKLIERLKLRNENGSLGEITEGDQLQAAEAIEALQGEVKRLTMRLKLTSDTMNSYNLQHDALQAKLDELEKQEPVAHQFQTEIDKKWHNFIDDEHYHHTVDDGRWPIRALFAAPKALVPTVLKPFTPCVCHDDTAKRYCKDKGKCSHFVAHGIGGTQ